MSSSFPGPLGLYVESGSFVVAAVPGTSTTNSITLGTVYYYAFDLYPGQTYTGMATDITVVAAGGTTPLIHLGLYADDGTGSRPVGAALANTEVTLDPTASTGDRYVAWGAAQQFAASRVWAAWMLTSGTALGTTCTVATLNPTTNIGLASLGNNSHRGGWQQSASGSASTLPTVSGIFRSGGLWPIIGMKVQ